MWVMGDVYAGRFELVDLVGSGAHGSVWRVWDHRDGGYLAGKVLSQADSVAIVRFFREQGLRFQHPHIVAPLGWVGEDDRVMFTMPLVRGGSLTTLLNDYGALPQRWALAITDQLLSALEVVHGAEVVHRDIKPHNILLEPGTQPHVRVSDFGTAVSVADDSPRLTRLHHVVGTPGYLASEAAEGADPDPLQDLYAVGVVLWQMLTGERPPRLGTPAVPVDLQDTALGGFLSRLLAPAGSRTHSATEARRQLRIVPAQAAHADEPVEVFDQVGALPEGWGPDGPTPAEPGPIAPITPAAQEPIPARRAPRWPVAVALGVAAVGIVLLVVAGVLLFA